MTYEQAGRLRRAGTRGATEAPSSGFESWAELAGPAEGQQTVIHYHFPVEIEVRAAPEPIDPEEIVQEVLVRLAQRCEST